MLSADELARYRRQMTLPEVGASGQERLAGARVLIVGAGGLGSPVAQYLAAAGVGALGIVDSDVVEPSNLHRQVLHGTPDIGRRKTESAADSIERINPGVRVEMHPVRLSHANARSIIGEYDVVVDGSDNYETRYAVNDACAALGKRWVFGSVERFVGQISVFGDADGPCYRCVFPEAPAPGTSPSCEEIGVLGAVPGVVGGWQAAEALKLLLGIGSPLAGRMLQIDIARGRFLTVEIMRREDCAVCGQRVQQVEVVAGAETPVVEDIAPAQLAERLTTADPPALLDVREPWEWQIARIGEPQLVPLNDLPAALDVIDRKRELVVYCHHGVRSRLAAEWLRAQGYRAMNLAGGIDRWSREVDTSMPAY